MSDILYSLFDPLKDSIKSIPNLPGNYIVTLRKESCLPDIEITPTFKKFRGLNVIYTGLAGTSLRDQDARKHFRGNAGSSILRKSIGSLFGYELVPRDSKYEDNKKTKYGKENEGLLSEWMTRNFLFFYYPNSDFQGLEDLLIQKYNPPLNLDKNHNQVNEEFRKKLSMLRNKALYQSFNPKYSKE